LKKEFVAKEKLVMPKADPPLAENYPRTNHFVIIRGRRRTWRARLRASRNHEGLSSPPSAAKNVRTTLSIRNILKMMEVFDNWH